MKRMLAFAGVYSFTYNSGIAVLSPTDHDYEDAFADMYVKAVYFAGNGATRATYCKVRENSKGLYFVKFGRRYYLDDFMRCDICGHVEPHEYKLINF